MIANSHFHYFLPTAVKSATLPSNLPNFPPVTQVASDGLIKLGGKLTVEWLLAAYLRGIFPWPIDEDRHTPVAWWCPDPRGVIVLDELHVSRSLRRTLRRQPFEITTNRDFASVIHGCAETRDGDDSTWITAPLAAGFIELHQQGFAHSVEVWADGALVGGIYGVMLGRYFSAESMFFRQRDASKVALVHLLQQLRACGLTWVDVQVINDHTERFGAREISRHEFLAWHAVAIRQQPTVDANFRP